MSAKWHGCASTDACARPEATDGGSTYMRLAAVEGGGTTFVVAIAEGSPENIVERAEFDTTTPQETLGHVKKWLSQREYDALGELQRPRR